MINELEVLAQSQDLLPLLTVLSMACSYEAFSSFVSPLLFNKTTSSPSKYVRKMGRLEFYRNLFHSAKKTRGNQHTYVDMMHALVASSGRYERFTKDEVLSTIILVEGNLSGYIAAKDVERFGRQLDDLLQLQPTHVELVLRNYFMQLIAAMYARAKVDELSPDLRRKLSQLLKDVRKKGRIGSIN
ncbi:hypothetical protein EON65_24065 [archaeon]|nr:MAG: hypothetical protein EON65_24065 [archaeon]